MCRRRPESRGRATLRSSDPAERVRIQANYYATEADRRAFRDGLRMARELAAQPAFEGWRGAELNPGPGVRSGAEVDAYVRRAADTIYHPVGTIRMGVDDQEVVDAQLGRGGREGWRGGHGTRVPGPGGGKTKK